MNADILTTKVADGIAVVTLGSAKRIYFDAEMGDALTEALEKFAGDPSVRVVVVTGGAPGYFNRHFTIPALIEIAESLRTSGRHPLRGSSAQQVTPSEFAPAGSACYRAWRQFVRCFFCLKRCSASQLSALC